MALVTVEELKAVLNVGDLYADEALQQTIDAVTEVIEAYVTAEAYEAEPASLKEAALNLSVDAWQARLSSGQQLAGVDFTPAPFRFGRSFVQKIIGYLAISINVDGMIA